MNEKEKAVLAAIVAALTYSPNACENRNRGVQQAWADLTDSEAKPEPQPESPAE